MMNLQLKDLRDDESASDRLAMTNMRVTDVRDDESACDRLNTMTNLLVTDAMANLLVTDLTQ
jgi:hypothetical protein